MLGLELLLSSRSVISNPLWPHGLQHPGLPVPHPLLEFAQIHVPWVTVMLSNHLLLCRPRLPLPSIFPGIRVFSTELAFHIRWPKYWSFSFSTSPSNEHSGLISLGLTGWISLQSKGLTRVFSTQFKGINSSGLGLLYGPTLISVHDYWKNCSFDYMELCWQSDVSAFLYVV